MAAKIKERWDLDGLFFKGIKDPKIKSEIDQVKKDFEWFEKKYRAKTDYLKDEAALFSALRDLEKISDPGHDGALYYFFYRTALNSDDIEAQALANQYSQMLSEYSTKISFFRLNLAKISIQKQKAFLKSEKLKPYRFLLEDVFKWAKYDLSEKEERIMSLTSLPAGSMWVDGVEKLIGKQTVKHRGKKIPITKSVEIVADLPKGERRSLWKKSMETLRDNVGDFAESEINAIVTNKKIRDKIRGFEKPYTSSILGKDNTEEEVMNLVDAVSDNYKISKRFYTLKKRLLKLDHLEYPEVYRGTPIGKISGKFTYLDTFELLREEFYGFGKVYGEILDRFAKNGQIDAFPKKGKTGGAFCSHCNDKPTLVLLNHVDTTRSVTTFAHEMGHAIHFELAREKQPVFYRGASTSTAETASTFFENLVFERLLRELSPKEQIIALQDKINDAVCTTFRQIAGFQFELALHEEIRAKGYVPKERIAELHNKHMSAYMGPSVKLGDADGYWFVKWSHIRMSFYLYAYAYGHLISTAMFENYKNDKKFETKVRAFLEAGSSKKPAEIFSDIGMNVTDPNFFSLGVKAIDRDIKLLEKLTKG